MFIQRPYIIFNSSTVYFRFRLCLINFKSNFIWVIFAFYIRTDGLTAGLNDSYKCYVITYLRKQLKTRGPTFESSQLHCMRAFYIFCFQITRTFGKTKVITSDFLGICWKKSEMSDKPDQLLACTYTKLTLIDGRTELTL